MAECSEKKPVRKHLGEKGEIAPDERFLLFPTVFSEDLYRRHVKIMFCLGKGFKVIEIVIANINAFLGIFFLGNRQPSHIASDKEMCRSDYQFSERMFGMGEGRNRNSVFILPVRITNEASDWFRTDTMRII